MKSRKLMGVLALASCVMLAGCGGDKPQHEHTFSTDWSSNETQHWHAATCEHTDLKSDVADHVDANGDLKCDVCNHDVPAPEPMIKFVDLPVSITTGETIDLKDYIKTKGDASFDINFDDESFELVDIDGTKVTGLKEGEANFTVSCKGEELQGSFGIMSLLRQKFLEWTDGVGYDYSLYGPVYDENYEEILGYTREVTHNENYFLISEFNDGLPGGLALIDEHAYFYGTDAEMTTATAEPGYYSVDTFDRYNCPIELNDEIFETETLKKSVFGVETEALLCRDADYAYEISVGVCGYGELTNGYMPIAVGFIYDEYEEEGEVIEDLLFATFFGAEGSTTLYGDWAITFSVETADHPFFEEADIGEECVEEMIKNKVVPAPREYFNDVNVPLNALLSADNYSVNYSHGWFDSKGDPLDKEDYPSWDKTVFEDCADSFVNGYDTNAITETAISEYIYSDEAYTSSKGFMEVDEKIYSYTLLKNGNYNVDEESYESFEELDEQRFGFLRKESEVENPLFPEDLVYDYNTKTGAYLMNVDAQNALFKKLLLKNATLSPIITKALDPYMRDYDRDLYSFFDGSIYVEADSVTFEWSFRWDDDTIFYIDVEIGHAGTTTVPADIVSAVEDAVHAL